MESWSFASALLSPHMSPHYLRSAWLQKLGWPRNRERWEDRTAVPQRLRHPVKTVNVAAGRASSTQALMVSEPDDGQLRGKRSKLAYDAERFSLLIDLRLSLFAALIMLYANITRSVPVDEIRFADVMQRERERLTRERDEILNQQKDLENKLTEVNREFVAIDAYEAAKIGKAAAPRRQSTVARESTAAIKQPSAEAPARSQRGSRREALLQVIGGEPNGLSRGEIFHRLGLKGNKSTEKSVSNALTALTKNNQVSRREGKYVIDQ
jgi:hypothetical protein